MENDEHLEVPGTYAFALWNLIIRPPRRRYHLSRLGPKEFRLWSCGVKRVDVDIPSARGPKLRCSHFLPEDSSSYGTPPEPSPCVIYLHQNASCRLEALQLVPLFLPLGISLFCLDFAGCGESGGEYISLGWFERDDLAECVKYLRASGRVSSIGLWGRSMGAVTALLHADRDHSIAGMVLDSPFCNLRQLATELAQSDYLSVKVPTWLLFGALALARLRIKLLCNFDIDELSPEEHVGVSFIPALFIHGSSDDFIAPHHSKKLFEAYTGDKDFELVLGDHNTPRDVPVIKNAVSFLVQALRCSVAPAQGRTNLATMLGFDPIQVDGAVERGILKGQVVIEAARQLALAGSEARKLRLMEIMKAGMHARLEAAAQIMESAGEAGFCLILLPAPTDYGGSNRPPTLIFALCSSKGLQVQQLVEGKEPKILAEASVRFEVGIPVMLVLELTAPGASNRPGFGALQLPRLRMLLGTGGPEINVTLEEEYRREVFFWPMTRGEAELFDTEVKSLEEKRVSTSSAPSSTLCQPTSEVLRHASAEPRLGAEIVPEAPDPVGAIDHVEAELPSISSCCHQS
eukprot:TRINITY_DN75027_c0_g1_i1.p1 TRINITY_DN75027_c0_g1~~TRINITY_DN75027_c0_g1_i1.p1  ORF type:complete len:583 (-),score=107.29 TRINITY_DN75027_c0_g1_i1:57-1778(-)